MGLAEMYPCDYLIGTTVGGIAATAAAYATTSRFGFDRRAATVAVATSCLFYTLLDGAWERGLLPILQSKFAALAPARFQTRGDKRIFKSYMAYASLEPFLAISMLFIAELAQKATLLARRDITPLPVAQCLLLGQLYQQGIKYPLEYAIRALLHSPE
jgi:hypothetical protein